MAYTKNPNRYPQAYFTLLDDVKAHLHNPSTFPARTGVYPTEEAAKNARHHFLGFRAALKHHSQKHPELPHFAELYALSLHVTTNIEGRRLTLDLHVNYQATAPLWETAPLAQTQPTQPIQPTPDPSLDPSTDAFWVRLENEEILKSFPGKLRSHYFAQTFKELPLDLPTNPREAIALAQSITAHYRPSDELTQLASAAKLSSELDG